MNDVNQKIISASLLRLRIKSPFFATLALFAQFRPTQSLDTAATDGKDIFFNPEYLQSLPTSQQDGLLLHEILHAALLHVSRRGVRDPLVWNVAADIVVDTIIMQQGDFELPPGGVIDIVELLLKPEYVGNTRIENLSMEEIYELLLKHKCDRCCLSRCDLIDNASAQMEAYWRNALQQAAVVAHTVNHGNLPVGIERQLSLLTSPQLDWRSYLWRYLVQTPTDFSGFDRRFIGRGLYLESLVGESVQVYVAVDTSGSIDNQQLQMFLTEVQGILNAYPHLQCDLYYVDAEAYGAYPLTPDSIIPSPQGGGGTSFVPFFTKVQESWDGITQGVCIYLTDGYGTFPSQPPQLPVLWVVTPGGLDLGGFPFGEAVRLLSV